MPDYGTTTITAAFAASAARNASRPAVRQGMREISFAEVDQLRRDGARGLIALGIRPGERVAIWGVNSLDWIVAGLALLTVGAVLVPVGTRLRGREAGAILRSADVRLIFTDHGFGGYDFVDAIHSESLPKLEHIVVLRSDAEAAGQVRGWSSLVRAGAGVAAQEVDRRAGAIRPDDLSDVLFTSGTTGQPKGVMMTHAQSIVACDHQARALGARSDDVLGALFPFAHNAGYRSAWQTSLLLGMRIDPIDVVNPDDLLQFVQANRTTLLPAVPTVYQSLIEHPARRDMDLSSLRVAMTGGTMVPMQLIFQIREQLGIPHIVNAYGMTETAGNISYTRAGDSDEVIARTVGRPLENLEVRIVDDNMRPLARDMVGQIAVRGFQVTHGYLNDAPATARSMTQDGFLLTGDIGLLGADGNLRITDRLKDMYICGGFNCYPAEVEEVFRKMPGVWQAAVVGMDDARLGQVGRAFIVAEPGLRLNEQEVIAWARENMAGYKVPRVIRFLDALPLNALGKVSKDELRQLD
ncbi:acyl-CoA synthetase (AMP-forming)/AMP-acid ligase II [Sphingomonas jinjuensis]|uniref:Acyl-CoA synthetase (AMP-forming)/AMP-acid ligase II n=1 Tax=Sphingomonas jinjuensis TaxID=535907 RepID=A0A840FP76_9SPHN|nr:AMP-binding protein [Sphingomonas jinjuensis]MBB4155085.1 acyl-CoA synthetase (AMP-forming)/AMP-acid ligase II [Sphingomonas jinjuensis]